MAKSNTNNPSNQNPLLLLSNLPPTLTKPPLPLPLPLPLLLSNLPPKPLLLLPLPLSNLPPTLTKPPLPLPLPLPLSNLPSHFSLSILSSKSIKPFIPHLINNIIIPLYLSLNIIIPLSLINTYLLNIIYYFNLPPHISFNIILPIPSILYTTPNLQSPIPSNYQSIILYYNIYQSLITIN